jgi:hypothetical protein
MWVYVLLTLPALLCALTTERLSRVHLVLIWLAVVPVMAWLMPDGSRDYTTYLSNYEDFGAVSFLEAVRQDPLYATSAWLSGRLGFSGEVYFLIASSAGLWVKLTGLHRLSNGSALAVLAYFCSFHFLHDFTQLRAGFALGILMHALASIERSRRRYLWLTLLATTIHIQASLGFVLFGLLMLARSERWVRQFCLAVVIIVATSTTRLFDEIGYAILARIPDPRTEIYLAMAAEEIWVRPNPFSSLSLMALAVALTGLLSVSRTGQGVRSEYEVARSVFVSLAIGSAALSVLSSVSVAAFRISEHFFVLLPVGAALALQRLPISESIRKAAMFALAGILLFIFVFHSPYLVDPSL